MPIKVVLEAETGVRLETLIDLKGDLLLDKTEIVELKPRLLHYVDPYGQTEFNHLQVESLLRDLDGLVAKPSLAEERKSVLVRVRNLASKSLEIPRSCVRMFGD